jgi:hypothetical protein
MEGKFCNGLPAGKYSLTITPDISKTCIKEVIIQDIIGNRSNKNYCTY